MKTFFPSPLARWFFIASFIETAFVLAAMYFSARFGPHPMPQFIARDMRWVLSEAPEDKVAARRYFERYAQHHSWSLTFVETDGQTHHFGPPVRDGHENREPRESADNRKPHPHAPEVSFTVSHGMRRLRAERMSPPPPRMRWHTLLLLLGAGIAVMGTFTLIFERRVIRRINALANTVKRIAEGDLSARADDLGNDEIGQLARRMNVMAAEIALLLSAKDELIGAVAHELRTPLARLHVALDLLAETPSDAPSLIASTSRDLGDLERVVDDVLELARSTSTRISNLERTPLEIDELLEIDTHDATVRSTLSPQTRVLGHARLLRRALSNIVDNARTHGASDKPMLIELSEQEHQVQIAVRDYGVGMAPQNATQAFEPFFRVDSSRARQTGGVGLGLALAKRFVEASGGSIWLESAEGLGTTVTIRVPRAI